MLGVEKDVFGDKTDVNGGSFKCSFHEIAEKTASGV